MASVVLSGAELNIPRAVALMLLRREATALRTDDVSLATMELRREGAFVIETSMLDEDPIKRPIDSRRLGRRLLRRIGGSATSSLAAWVNNVLISVLANCLLKPPLLGRCGGGRGATGDALVGRKSPAALVDWDRVSGEHEEEAIAVQILSRVCGTECRMWACLTSSSIEVSTPQQACAMGKTRLRPVLRNARVQL